ncbi:G-protein alpha subunit-domain-containing protein [Cantharellus anzutake]|uniref:G-protein alpha subunit-domain-containing protein n=1 Tax=Cantharellus anzutake TaxID=1750568 RepID=UPI00190567CF|nr:G-protein alpha subunit-domain-containing protein [Cantharellus anzutake]KAF8326013.1 G-protein alpha subunit-domain-containing protein [Cantharellus anzutake]
MGFPDDNFIPSSIGPEFMKVDPQPEYYFFSKNWMKKPLGQHGGATGGSEGRTVPYEDPSDYVVALAQDVKEVWEMPVVKEALAYCRVRLEEYGGFFLNDIDRIAQPEYLPTNDDIIRCRIKTLGASAHYIPAKSKNPLIKPKTFRIYDVGGSRSQRAAWVPYFENLNLIVFLLPLSAFDQFLEEDPHVNRLKDSLDLWKSIVTNPAILNVPIALLINKCDLAKAKLAEGVDIRTYITSYQGPNTFDGLVDYIKPRLQKLCLKVNPRRTLYVYYTVVSDCEKAGSLVNSLHDLIVRHSIEQATNFGDVC